MFDTGKVSTKDKMKKEWKEEWMGQELRKKEGGILWTPLEKNTLKNNELNGKVYLLQSLPLWMQEIWCGKIHLYLVCG